MDDRWKVLAATHLLAFGAGWAIAPREMLESGIRQTGLFRVERQRVLSAAVESLRSEGRLLVYSYRGSAAVSVERDGLLLDGRQDLIAPAVVGFYVDVSRIDADDVEYDERSGAVMVRLPPLTMGDVAFEPEGARTFNGGLLTYSQRQVDELSRLNYASARRAFVKQAQGEALVRAAEAEAGKQVERYLEVPLRAVGVPARVVATFGGRRPGPEF
jgi:hypothetical protein